MSTTTTRELPPWPALAGAAEVLPSQLTYGRGVWGKVHGAASDFRWIAATPGLETDGSQLPQQLSLGAEDRPQSCLLWRSIGERHIAVHCYPSRAVDAAGRSGFLEKQVLLWRQPAQVPAALAALLLLPRAGELDDQVWWQHRDDTRLLESTFQLELEGAAQTPIEIDGPALTGLIETGISQLEQLVGLQALTGLYAGLLAGRQGIALTGLEQPLPAAAMAVLLLPLPRALADRISIAGWLPSSRADRDDLASRWDVVVPDPTPGPLPEAAGPEPTAEHLATGRRLAEALLSRTPSLAISSTDRRVSEDQVTIALWGPSAAGKTVLLAQLYLAAKTATDDIPWEVFPTEGSLGFIKQMRQHLVGHSAFPPATAVGAPESVVYRFANPHTGTKASLLVEDRAGVLFEKLEPDAQERLRSADGLVLLFDPLRDPATLEQEVSSTLEEVHVSGKRDAERDDRPIAVCITKADLLISTPHQLQLATDDPDTFIRTHDSINPVLLTTLERFCTRFKLFPVSAVGIHLHHGVVDSPVFYDQRMTPRIARNGAPFHLLEPFAWVLDQVTGSAA